MRLVSCLPSAAPVVSVWSDTAEFALHLMSRAKLLLLLHAS